MTTHPRHAFNVAPGAPQPSLAVMIFRPLLRLARRKPAAPAAFCPAGAAGDGGSDWDDAMPVMDDGRPACWLPLADKLWPPAEPARHPETAPGGYPVLRDRMISQVRNEWDRQGLVPAQQAAHADAVHATAARYLPAPPRPVNGQVRPDRPRRAVPFSELNRKFSDGRPTPELLRDVLAGLKKLGTEQEATYRGGWQ